MFAVAFKATVLVVIVGTLMGADALNIDIIDEDFEYGLDGIANILGFIAATGLAVWVYRRIAKPEKGQP